MELPDDKFNPEHIYGRHLLTENIKMKDNLILKTCCNFLVSKGRMLVAHLPMVNGK